MLCKNFIVLVWSFVFFLDLAVWLYFFGYGRGCLGENSVKKFTFFLFIKV